jgi:putative FmdB family regulatory protein
MPLYEFECGACGSKFEKLLPIEQRHTALCPDCNSGCARTAASLCSASFKLHNKFTADGPGFQSVMMSKDEHKHRLKERSLEEGLKQSGKTPVYYNPQIHKAKVGNIIGDMKLNQSF